MAASSPVAWSHLSDETPAATVAGAELLVHDALDGAITLALHALTTHIEEVREDFLATTLHDTGLGLYLSYGIVEAHGGRLTAESAGLGQGTAMHIDLPRSVPPPRRMS